MRVGKRFLALVIAFVVCSAGLIPWALQHQRVTLRVGFPSGSYWNVPSSDSYTILDAAIERFEQENPNVKVEYTKGILQRDYYEWLIDGFLTGKSPDVFLVLPENFNDLVALDALAPLSACQEEWQPEWYYPAALESGQFQNEQYALPYECVPTMMFVNRTLLEKEGIAMPDENWTWQDFYTLCQQMTKDSNGDGVLDQFGVYGYTWMDAMTSNGASLFDKDGKSCDLTSQNAVKAIAFAMSLDRLCEDYPVKQEDFDLGRVLFQPMPFSEYRAYQPYPWRIKKYSSFEWDCVPMPYAPTGSNSSELATLQMAISSRSGHKKLAWKLLKLLTCDPDIQMMVYSDSCACSALTSVTQSDTAAALLRSESLSGNQMNMDQISQVLKTARAAPRFSNYSQLYTQADALVRAVMSDPDYLNLKLTTAQLELNRQLR